MTIRMAPSFDGGCSLPDWRQLQTKELQSDWIRGIQGRRAQCIDLDCRALVDVCGYLFWEREL